MAKRKKVAKPCRVAVTLDDIRHGEAGDCFRCSVARALQRATGDSEANVYESLDGMFLEVHGRILRVPGEVRQFVWAFDALDRLPSKRVVLPDPLPADLQPFVFDLPPLNDPEWQERCYGCEQFHPPDELDGEGNCPECRED